MCSRLQAPRGGHFAEQKYTVDELAQYFASSVAVFDDVPAVELQLISGVCAANAPGM